MSIIENLANTAREALANEIMKHSPAKNLNAQNVTDWINTSGNVGNLNVDASAVVNAWEHAYISGLIYDKSNSTTIAYITGYAKEIGLGAITNTADAYKDLYNNKTGIDIAQNSGVNFSGDLYGSIFEPDSESKGRIKIKDNPGPILDLNNDDRMKGADLDSKMQKMLASLSQIPDLLGRIAENFKDSKISGIYAIDPLLVDLDGNGIETTPLTDGMMMDHDKDGFKELSAWVGGNDGILAYDKNNNGIIDNGNELFGDNYEKADGTIATSGFDALSDLDTNNVGVINSSDESFSNLHVIKADGSVISIEEAGIASINLTNQSKNDLDESGNRLLHLGSYTTTDGQTRNIGDYSLQVNKTISIAAEEVEVSAEIEALPYVPGYGVVHNLHQAMALDETGELQELVESFVAETNVGEKKRNVDRAYLPNLA